MTDHAFSDPDLAASLGAPESVAQALASRICHDLVSPIGAVANGADLITTFGASASGEEIDMIAQSAARAAALLGFFRLAFGAAPPDSGEITRAKLGDTLGRMLASHRIGCEIEGEGPAITRAEARAVALAALSARTTLGMRGAVRVVLAGAGALPVTVTAEGEVDAGRTAQLEAHLTHGGLPVEPSKIEFALLRPAAEAVGASVALETGAERVALSVRRA